MQKVSTKQELLGDDSDEQLAVRCTLRNARPLVFLANDYVTPTMHLSKDGVLTYDPAHTSRIISRLIYCITGIEVVEVIADVMQDVESAQEATGE